jgi:hypothetical protein
LPEKVARRAMQVGNFVCIAYACARSSIAPRFAELDENP